MYKNLLKKLWLTEEESFIYLFLLENPKKTITDISKQASINRPKLYKILPYMKEQWLISEVLIWKRNFYMAENPKILNSYLSSIKRDFETFIPEIENLYSNSFTKPLFKHLTWNIGIKNIFLDIGNTLKKGDTFYRYSSRNNVKKTSIANSDYVEYKTIREKKELQRLVITNSYLQSIKEEKLNKEVVIIPKTFDLFEDNITKIIYANKVAIIDYNTRESFVIESSIFANFERKIFTLLFRFLKN